MRSIVRPPRSICDFCYQTLLLSQKSWGMHHQSLTSLEISAKQCCIFCTNLLQEARAHFPELAAQQNLPWPLYRWTIQSCAETRDVNQVRSIVFRPLHKFAAADGEEIADLIEDQMFYLYHKNDHEFVSKRERLGVSTNSSESWTQIHRWIGLCRGSHSKCQQKQNTSHPLPTRLLDISKIMPDEDDNQAGHIKLVVTAAQAIQEPYITLSHSWGKGRAFVTVNAQNQTAMMTTGMRLNDQQLTKNFREAIRVARKLGINYIWIDSLCILQQDKFDFAIEAPKMHFYYRHSYCNIAAANSSDPDQGLFRNRALDDGGHPRIPAEFESDRDNKIFGSASWYVVPGDFWARELLTEPLYKRGWVFQERMLAPRLLHFAKDQIFFECAEMTACETMPDGFPRGVDTRAALDRYWRQRLHHSLLAKDQELYGHAEISIEEFWKTSVNAYTRCELTNGNDKLVAISGVATVIGEILDEPYGDGFWAECLEEQLAWRVVDLCQANGTPSKRPDPPRCSTWSWASIDAVIELRDRLVDREYRVTNHEGNRVSFEVMTIPTKVSIPHVLMQGLSTRSERAITSKVVGQDPVGPACSEHHGMLMDLPSIKITGYVRKGEARQSSVSSQSTLYMPKDARDDTSAAVDLAKIFFDEPPTNSLTNCHYMVLAYSRTSITPADDSIFEGSSNLGAEDHDSDEDVSTQHELVQFVSNDAPPPTFSGIGLVLHEIAPDHYVRLGSFTFNDLFEESLLRMVVPKHDVTNPELPQNVFLH